MKYTKDLDKLIGKKITVEWLDKCNFTGKKLPLKAIVDPNGPCTPMKAEEEGKLVFVDEDRMVLYGTKYPIQNKGPLAKEPFYKDLKTIPMGCVKKIVKS